MVGFYILDLISEQDFLFPKGVVDGERPLKFILSKFWVLVEKSDLYLYLTSKDILRAFQKNKFLNKFNLDTQKAADIVLYFFPQGIRGESDEKKLPEDAHTIGSRGF